MIQICVEFYSPVEYMDFDYSKISDFEKSMLPVGFEGNVYNLSYKWLEIIPATYEKMKILEIGSYHGANACSLLKTYALHPKSEIHCVDPWTDYEGYNEYKDKQMNNYSTFINNISKLFSEDMHKIHIHRMLSENCISRFPDESFDIIYIDGNHEVAYVIEDAIISLKKVKRGGWIIFDDAYDEEVKKAMQIFLHVYASSFENEIFMKNGQAYIKRKL